MENSQDFNRVLFDPVKDAIRKAFGQQSPDVTMNLGVTQTMLGEPGLLKQLCIYDL